MKQRLLVIPVSVTDYIHAVRAILHALTAAVMQIYVTVFDEVGVLRSHLCYPGQRLARTV